MPWEREVYISLLIKYLKDEKENPNSVNALKHFLSIKIGDKIAVKASGSPKGSKGFLSIVGICEVVQDEEGKVYNYDPKGLGHTINVKYLGAPIYKEYELGGYGSTVHHLSKEDHIELIFGNSKNITTFEKVKGQFDNIIFESFIRLKAAGDDWIKDCRVWLYKGAWQEWDIAEIEMAIPMSPDQVMKKRNGIFIHQSQKDMVPFQGDDSREFWQRAEERNSNTANLYAKLGLTKYAAIEAFVRWHF